jgi:hypothetical protein
VGRGGVSGRKFKGLDGTGVDPSSGTERKHNYAQYYRKGTVMVHKARILLLLCLPEGKDRVLVGVGVASLLLSPSEGVAAPASLMLTAQAGSYCKNLTTNN